MLLLLLSLFTVTSKRGPQQCVTNLRVSSSCGTLQRNPTKDREFWLLNSPPSVVSFEVICTAVTVALRLRLELIFLHRCPPLTRSITEALKGAMYHFIHMAHLSVQPRERERTNGRRRSSRHAYSYSNATMWQLRLTRSS